MLQLVPVAKEAGLNLTWFEIPKTHFCMLCFKPYTTLINFSTKDLAMCKVYTDVGGIK